MLLYVVRHGEPIYNPDTLTELGKKQAAALAPYFVKQGLDEVYSSPNGRARQTAEPTCKALGLEMQLEPWTSEDLAWQDLSIDYDEGYRGWIFTQPAVNFRTPELAKAGWDGWLQAPGVEKIPEPEKKYQRIIDASDDFLERLGYRREGSVYRILEKNEKRVALFCHGGFSTFWFAHLLGLPPHLFWAGFTLPHACVSKFFFANNDSGVTVPRCLEMAGTGHLYKENVDYKAAEYGV